MQFFHWILYRCFCYITGILENTYELENRNVPDRNRFVKDRNRFVKYRLIATCVTMYRVVQCPVWFPGYPGNLELVSKCFTQTRSYLAANRSEECGSPASEHVLGQCLKRLMFYNCVNWNVNPQVHSFIHKLEPLVIPWQSYSATRCTWTPKSALRYQIVDTTRVHETNTMNGRHRNSCDVNWFTGAPECDHEECRNYTLLV